MFMTFIKTWALNMLMKLKKIANPKNIQERKNVLKINILFVTYKIVYSFIKC